jgi:hypothetical protein
MQGLIARSSAWKGSDWWNAYGPPRSVVPANVVAQRPGWFVGNHSPQRHKQQMTDARPQMPQKTCSNVIERESTVDFRVDSTSRHRLHLGARQTKSVRHHGSPQITRVEFASMLKLRAIDIIPHGQCVRNIAR